MTRIDKHSGFWKQKGWFVLAVVSGLLQVVVHRNNPYFLALFFILGAIGVYVVFFTKTFEDDFIEWDKATIKIKEDGQEYHYSQDDIDQVSFKNNHLKIKSGPANGILVNLKGYSPKDILLLKTYFDISENATVEILA